MLNDKVLAAVLEFRRKRDWEQFHKPKELAAAIAVHDEVARLLESPSRVRVEDEIADVVILLSYLCHDLGLDVNAAVLSKLKKNEAKYPVEKSYGNARKYDE
jgi:NTP pyrophosphatase (non-canonical NTP hydrolase)